MNQIFIKIISLYQKYLSPDHSIFSKAANKPPFCRHIPSCSEYCKECFETFSFPKAFYKSSKRIISCHPFAKPKYDPVIKDKN